jgi:hypothetical protein
MPILINQIATIKPQLNDNNNWPLTDTKYLKGSYLGHGQSEIKWSL